MTDADAICPHCGGPLIEDDEVLELLEELVELKRAKDSGRPPAEYPRLKVIAWTKAFRLLGVPGEPKP